ncbi:MAG: hypothetical protein L0212_12820, partial [Acidobacteria bacterium]|nr:hypothetical protein [Acidobacteriota bacterium]
MAEAYQVSVPSIKTRVYQVEESALFFFQETSRRVRAQVSELNHRRKFTIHEKRCLDNMVNTSEDRPLRVIVAHYLGKAARDGFVVVLNQYTQRVASFTQEGVEPSYDLLKRHIEVVRHMPCVGLRVSIGKRTNVCP